MNEATMTFGEFIQESENYRYSKEYFNLVKECNELELMELYAETADYIVENPGLEQEVLSGFIVEAAAAGDEETKNGLKEKMAAVKTSITNTLDKLWQMVKRACASFVRLIIKWWTGTHAKRLEEVEKLAKSIEGKLGSASAEDIQRVNDKIRHLGSTVEKFKETPVKEGGLSNITVVRDLPAPKGEFDLNMTLRKISAKFKNTELDLDRTIKYVSQSYVVRGPKILETLPKIYSDINEILSSYASLDEEEHSKQIAALASQASKLESRLKSDIAHDVPQLHFNIKMFNDLDEVLKRASSEKLKAPKRSASTFLRVMSQLLTELNSSVGKLVVVVRNHTNYVGNMTSYSIQVLRAIDGALKGKAAPAAEEKPAEEKKEEKKDEKE